MMDLKNVNARYYFNENLINCMNNICKTPITLISAPVGYGKTTVLREFFSRTNVNYYFFAHLRLSCLEEFWASFCGAILSCEAHTGQSIVSLGFPDNEKKLHDVLKLIGQLKLKPKTVLIFDDFHNIESADAVRFLTSVAKMAVPNLHIVISSRYGHPEVKDLILAGCANIITTKMFILSKRDIDSVFKGNDIVLSSRELHAVYSYTEGWAALIRNILMTIAWSSKLDNSSFLAFERDIVSSLTDVVYSPLPYACKDLLLRMCGEARFTAEQAAFVLGRPKTEVEEILVTLESLNALVLREESLNGVTYKVHGMLGKVLLEQFCLLPEVESEARHKKIADWFYSRFLYREAAGHYRAAGEMKEFFDAYEHVRPCGYGKEPSLILASFYVNASRNLSHYNALGVMTLAVELYFYSFEKFLDETLLCLDECVQSDAKLKAEAELILCSTSWHSLEKTAERVSSAAASGEKLHDKLDFLYGSPSILFLYHAKAGGLDETLSCFAKIMEEYRSTTDTGDSGAVFLMEAEKYYCQGEFDKSNIILQAAITNSLSQRNHGVWAASCFLNARLLMMQGEVDAAFEILTESRLKAEAYKADILGDTFDVFESYLHLMAHRPERVALWLLTQNLYEGRVIRPVMPFAEVTRGVYLVQSGRADEIVGNHVGKNWPRVAIPSVLCSIYVNIILSLAFDACGFKDNAVKSLGDAINAAIPDNFCTPFAEICPFLWETLNEAALLDNGYKPFIIGVKSAAHKLHALCNRLNGACERLTKRESEIATLIKEGLKNKEIAIQLNVSENTIKSTLKNIFRKMGISSRKEVA